MEHCQSKYSPLVREYVLPDYKNTKKGYVRPPSITDQMPKAEGSEKDEQQVVKIENARF